MSVDYLTLGCTPPGESCQQVGTANYDPIKAQRECRAYLKQLKREFGEPPTGARLAIKSFPHDFGSYSEVVVYFDEDIQESINYAFKLESECALNWDQEAIEELALLENNP